MSESKTAIEETLGREDNHLRDSLSIQESHSIFLRILNSFEGDLQTNLGALREFLTMEFNTLYLLLPTLELFASSRHKKTPLGYSLPSTVISTILATAIAYGSAVIQHAIDKMNEEVVEFTPYNLPSARPSASVDQPVDQKDEFHWEKLWEECINYLTHSGKLTPSQVAQLAMAKIGQASDLMGFAIGMSNTSPSLGVTTKIILTSIAFTAGILVSEAAIRPARNAMEFHNNRAFNPPGDDPNGQADGWTNIFLLAKILQTGIANIVFYATLADKINGYKSNTPFNMSKQGILDMLIPTVYVTFSVVFFQNFISVMNQQYSRPHENQHLDTESTQFSGQDTPEAAQPITFCEKTFITFLLMGRMLGTATDCSVPLLTALSDYLSPGAYVGVALGATVVGMGLCTSDWRTNKKNWDKYREKNGRAIDAWVKGVNEKIHRLSSNASILFRGISSCCQSSNNDLEQYLVSHNQT